MLAVAPGYELDVERGPDWLLVRVRNLDKVEPDTPPLAEYLRRLLQQHFTYRLVLEMDDVEELTDEMIEQLIQLHRWIEEHDGVLRICGLSSHNRQVLHSCRFDQQLPSYVDREEAVLGCPNAMKPR